MIISNAPVCACLTVTDLDNAKKFYTEKLGLKEIQGEDTGGVLLEAGEGSKIFIYTSGAPKATNTVAAFNVDDVLATVKELKEAGIEFESYDMDPIKTDENNIAHMGNLEAAWFKDPDGNILGISNS
jgi:catechol 2,3-dioxygenase-like lactoylglutathione lyase family enzyme